MSCYFEFFCVFVTDLYQIQDNKYLNWKNKYFI